MQENQFYTYLYLDSRKPGKFTYDDGKLVFDYEPFYVGKGKGNRYLSHLNEAKQTSNKSHKLNKIRKILKEEFDPIIIKILENITEQKSIDKEIELIWIIGRHDLGMGPLTNLTNGGDGFSGYMLTLENNSIYGKKCYNNGSNESYFYENKQPDGWTIGRLFCKGESHHYYGRETHLKGKRFYNDGKIDRRFYPERVPSGWILGRCDEYKKKCSDNFKGENNPLYGKSVVKNKKYYNNGIKEGRFSVGSQPDKWILGRLNSSKEKCGIKLKGRKWYNDGISQGMFMKKDIPHNWIPGRLSFK